MSHDAGHLWQTIFALKGNPRFDALHMLSIVLLIAGFWILSSAWPVLYRAQKPRHLATPGVYARMRHPQYTGFILIMLGFLVQWPTILTLVIFPVLVTMYVRLAISEERQAEKEFGQAWRDYAAHAPRFLPPFGGSRHEPIPQGRA
jgi:methanethiol S-methyltransferase